jgi:hypothetical protein
MNGVFLTIHWVSLLILRGRFIMKHMRHPVDPVLHWVYGIEKQDTIRFSDYRLHYLDSVLASIWNVILNRKLKMFFVQFAYFLITLANSTFSLLSTSERKKTS